MTPDVIVIGGGFAGLSAATALAERGARVVVLEARPVLGGRATAFTDPATGERVDNGQHVLFGCYRETFRFLQRIGAAAEVALQPRLAIEVVDRDGRRSRLTCPAAPARLGLAAGIVRWTALPLRDRVSVLRMALQRRPRAGETVRQWLVRCGQARRLVELLWEPLAVAALNQSIDVAAAAPFARVVSMLFASARGAALGLPARPLDELYAAPARSFVERRGGVVRTSAPARVSTTPRLIVRVRGEELAARCVICAVPWHAFDAVFEPCAALASLLDAARRTGSSPIVTVNLWLDRFAADGPFVGLPGRTFQWVFDKAALLGGSSSHLSLVASAAGAIVGLDNETLVSIARAELAAALPAARQVTVRRAVVVREKRATFSVAPGEPPRPGTVTAVAGLFLAGDWIDTGLPATIESAVASGHRAAAEAGTMLKLTIDD